MTYEEYITEVLGRWSVSDLYEQTDADLIAADERFYMAGDMEIIEQGVNGLIKFWKIRSVGKARIYECRRFKNFCWCECRSFFFGKKACKHLSLTALVLCANCHELPARVGKYCSNCDLNINHFLRQAKPVEFTEIGSRR